MPTLNTVRKFYPKLTGFFYVQIEYKGNLQNIFPFQLMVIFLQQ